MISKVKKEVENILTNHVTLENIKFSDFEYWEEDTNKSALVEWMNTESVALTIRKKANIINFNVYYLENVPKNKDKTLYLNNLELLVKEFSESFNLNKLLVSMRINTRKIERGASNNENFISRISITGQLPL